MLKINQKLFSVCNLLCLEDESKICFMGALSSCNFMNESDCFWLTSKLEGKTLIMSNLVIISEQMKFLYLPVGGVKNSFLWC